MFRIYFLTLILLSMLTGCASVPSFKNEGVTTPSKKGGGYYLDDGPGDHPPENIDAIPDATPKVEPFNARANQPYIALDNKYIPMTSFYPYKERGVASWYGKRYHGKKTSIGEYYDMYSMTGAHTTLPIPCYVRVTNTENGKSVIVRINDRGPFKKDRVIDLSFAAAYKLRLSDKGSGPVEVELIDPRQFSALKKTPDVITEKIKEKEVTPTQVKTEETIANEPLYIQAGAFKNEKNADLLLKQLSEMKLENTPPFKKQFSEDLFHVVIGPFNSKNEATNIADLIKSKIKISIFVIAKEKN
ncbi:MAG: septal ring lytic transglycosylase RlpA family protein [Methylophilaceae bacterium]|jgi:rare lipoprotein A|nr:septal ring lytic transglycosylase RlpA family protein [Methylophilaceae bacterium]